MYKDRRYYYIQPVKMPDIVLPPAHKTWEDWSPINVQFKTVSVSGKDASWIIPELSNRAPMSLGELKKPTQKSLRGLLLKDHGDIRHQILPCTNLNNIKA